MIHSKTKTTLRELTDMLKHRDKDTIDFIKAYSDVLNDIAYEAAQLQRRLQDGTATNEEKDRFNRLTFIK